MKPHIVWPSEGRITLVLLAIVPAVMSYPWSTANGKWILGVAVAVGILLLSFWHGRHITTIAARRLVTLRPGSSSIERQQVQHSMTDASTTAALRVLTEDTDGLPLDVIAGYLERYGLRADSVRITRRDTATNRSTWISLTLSATVNLSALQARSAQVPLVETAGVALRRLADQLREAGWLVSTAQPVEIPDLLGPQTRQKWRAIADGDQGFVAAYAVAAGVDVSQLRSELRALPSSEVWTVQEFSTSNGRTELALGAAVRFTEMPGAPAVPGLQPQNGRQREALAALHPLSVERLAGPRAAVLRTADTR